MASKEFSQKLKELRLRAGFSQKQVYEYFNIPQSTFSSWEVGKSEPSGEMLIKLCEYYNCDILNEFSTKNDMLTYNEFLVIEKYRELDTHGREMVDFTLLKEWERSKSSRENNDNIVPISTLNAAHEIAGSSKKDQQHDDDIMNDENF